MNVLKKSEASRQRASRVAIAVVHYRLLQDSSLFLHKVLIDASKLCLKVSSN
jgi:hypothetical protein